MESVEHEFLRHLGLSLMSRDATGPVSWPRVHAQCDYRGAARFDDVLTITLTISRLGEKSVTYQFDIRHDDRPVAEGEVTAVCCRIESGSAAAIDAHPRRYLQPSFGRTAPSRNRIICAPASPHLVLRRDGC